MVDIFSAKKRSWVMSRIKEKNTKPELKVRSIIHRMGYRFRLHKKDLPGKPDIVLPKLKKAIFFHGCFWHLHSAKNCPISHLPSSNTEYWNEKLYKNVERDKKHRKNLKRLGWLVLTIWECETKKPEKILTKLNNFL